MRSSVRAWLTVFISLALLAVFSGCSKDDDDSPSGPNPNEGSIHVHVGEDSTEMLFADLPTIDVDGEEAIQLDEFVDTTIVHMYEDNDAVLWDARVLYAYQIQGADGFSASGNRGYPDNIWEHMGLGYIVLSTGRAFFPDELIDLPGAYNVSDAADIYIHRKFDLVTPDSTVFVELKDVTSVQVNNHDGEPEDALPLADFVTAVFDNPDQFTYNCASLDEFGPDEDMTWEEFQTGYWLLVTGKTIFTDPGLVGGRYKLKVLEKITVTPIPAP